MDLPDLRALLDSLPPDALLPAGWVLDRLPESLESLTPQLVQEPEPVVSWRERVHQVPPQTELGMEEAAEALGVSRSWLEKRVAPGGEGGVPSYKREGRRVFLAGELVRWLEATRERTGLEAA